MENKALLLASKYKTLLNKYGITTPLRKAHLFGQLAEESHLTPIEENLNYSAERLLQVFPKYFKTITSAKAVERNPQKIANIIYGGRMGNNTIGDGYKYRGRGYIQITGKDNYTALTKDTGIDYINYPDKLLNEADSLISALWYWKKANCNKYADLDDIKSITKLINGGYINLEARIKHVNDMKKVFK